MPVSGDSPDGLCAAIAAQIEADGFTLRRGVCANPVANGETNWITHTVTVRDDLGPAQACRTLIDERAHIALASFGRRGSRQCRPSATLTKPPAVTSTAGRNDIRVAGS